MELLNKLIERELYPYIGNDMKQAEVNIDYITAKQNDTK